MTKKFFESLTFASGKYLPLSSYMLLLSSLCAGLLWCPPASADRHCSGVLNYYFQARAVVLNHEEDTKKQLSCSDNLSTVLERLAEASAEADACGCFRLRDKTQQLADELKIVDCETSEALLLAAKSSLEDELAECQ